MSILYFLRKCFMVLFAAIMFIGVTPNGAEPHTVVDEENCRMCITVLSDCHLESTNLTRFNVFGTILKDAANNSFGNDVALFLGDNTMNGQSIESPFFYGAVAKTNIADNILIACGNHDIGNGEGDYDKLYKRFKESSESITGICNDKPYYAVEIKGITFIVLCPEALCVEEFPIGDEQYEFLDETLRSCTSAGKPTFVLSHYPTVFAEDYGERLDAILGSYPNVFYLTGHTHVPICDGWTFSSRYGYNRINLPRCTELGGEEDNQPEDYTGGGVQLEVYDNVVIARARDYYRGNWIEDVTYRFELSM